MSNSYTAIYEKSFIGTALNIIDKSLFSGKLDMKHLAILKAMLMSLDYLLHKSSEEDDTRLEYLENKIEGFLRSCENFCTYKEVKDVFISIYGQVCGSSLPAQLTITNSNTDPNFTENIVVDGGETVEYILPTDNIVVVVDGQEEVNSNFNVYDSITINIQ